MIEELIKLSINGNEEQINISTKEIQNIILDFNSYKIFLELYNNSNEELIQKASLIYLYKIFNNFILNIDLNQQNLIKIEILLILQNFQNLNLLESLSQIIELIYSKSIGKWNELIIFIF